jgi:fatty-acyl-CoA synthase
MRYAPADRVCVPVPFYHCFGMVIGTLCCITAGCTMVVPAEAFDPLLTMQAIEKEKCTCLYGVPTMFIAQLDHPRFKEFDLTSLRTGTVGGSLVPQETMKRMIAEMHMQGTTIIYGMTETSPISTITTEADSFENRVSTVGRPIANVEIRIADPVTGKTLERGERGEFCARGYHVMPGYWENEAATRSSIDAAGWMHTGDLATMDEHGYVRIVGRIKDMIIRGGENIYPKEIEEVLMSHPAISEAQVIGIPSEKYGEEVMAWVRLRPGQEATEALLIAHCGTGLARYKIPRFWKFTDAFPLTVTGKVQKFRMREIAAQELGLNTERARAGSVFADD